MNARTILYLEWLRVNHDDLNFRLRCFQCHRCYNYTLVLLFEVLHYNIHLLKLNGMRMHVSHGTVKLRLASIPPPPWCFNYIILVSLMSVSVSNLRMLRISMYVPFWCKY